VFQKKEFAQMFHFKSWKFAVTVIAVIVPFILSSCKNSKHDPFPASGAIAGWQKTADTRVFEAKDLWQYIDGDSEQYIQAGVVSTSTSDYKYQGKLEAVLDVYSMRDAGGAGKILETGRSKQATSIQIGDAGIQYSQSVIFRKGAHLVRIVAYESNPDAPQALLALAHGVEANL
jgi:hypothetical protein